MLYKNEYYEFIAEMVVALIIYCDNRSSILYVILKETDLQKQFAYFRIRLFLNYSYSFDIYKMSYILFNNKIMLTLTEKINNNTSGDTNTVKHI
jgi:hypothetical protein